MIKVLIIDDSAIIREILRQELSKDPEIEVVGTAEDVYTARDLIIKRHPDVLTLDINMPRMDGLTFLQKLMASFPIPVIVVSSLTPKGSAMALEAMATGAVDVLSKPGNSYSTKEMTDELIEKIKIAASIDIKHLLKVLKLTPKKELRKDLILSSTNILAIGASTGGTHAIEYLLSCFPKEGPATIIVQHMPSFFIKPFVKRLSKICKMEIREAKDGDWVLPGTALIAPGGNHILLRRSGSRYLVNLKEGPPVNGHSPSIDILFRSIAETAGRESIGVLLSGAGNDGAAGMLKMKEMGALTLAQDKETSTAFAMAQAAIDKEAVAQVLPIERISEMILKTLSL